MKRIACFLASCAAASALAWGSDGHSIVAEIAQRHLTTAARAEAERLLGPGVSLASVSSWADDVRPARPETFNLHFVDIPVHESAYDPQKHCPATPKGDCIVAELERERRILSCPGTDAARLDALRFATHFVGDLHQPMHTVDEEKGANGIKVDVEIHAGKCPKCQARRTPDNLHAVWDTTLIAQTTWNWGAYVARLEQGWLASEAARGADAGTPVDWTLATHRVAAEVWDWLPADHLIGDEYYLKATPLVDRQLALAGVRLARFLNDSLDPARRGAASCAPSTPSTPATAAVATLRFSDMFESPVGPAGLHATAKLAALDGQRVQMAGYMVRRESAAAGSFILAPVPVLQGDEDESDADDIPATAVAVRLPRQHAGAAPAWRAGLIRVTGTLHVGAAREADGRWSPVQLQLDDENPSSTSKTDKP